MIQLRRCFLVLILLAGVTFAYAQEFGEAFGVRAGVGADITFDGLAVGGGVNHLFLDQLEVGLVVYYGNFEETSEEGGNEYDETTEVTAFAIMANYLYGYTMGESGGYFVAGVGLGYLSVFWEEKSDTDSSLGTPLPGGGSKQDFEGGVGGFLVSIGGGYAFAGGLDLRLEIPVLIANYTGDATGVIPLFTLTAGYRFGL
jgi:hypothetical protein